MAIPAKDFIDEILKTIQDSAREALGPDATADEIREAEWALALSLGNAMFNGPVE